MSRVIRSQRSRFITTIAVLLLVGAIATDVGLVVRTIFIHENPSLLQSFLAATATLISFGTFAVRQLAPAPRDLESMKKLTLELARSQRRLIRSSRNIALLSKRPRYVDLKLEMVNPPNRTLATRLSVSSQIGQLVREVEGGRIVVIGAPGAGKSVLALDVADSIASEESADLLKIPVFLPVQEWNIERTNVNYWLASQLVQILGIERTVAWELIEEGRLFPIFDGLDEMDSDPSLPERSANLLAALEELDSPFLLTMRTETWERLKDTSKLLEETAAIKLSAASGVQVVSYLESRRQKNCDLTSVNSDINNRPHGLLASALATPFDLVLAGNLLQIHGGAERLSLYVDQVHDASSRAALDSALMSSFFASRARWHPKTWFDKTRVERHPYRPGVYYPEEKIINWCRLLAEHVRPRKDGRRSGISVERMWTIGGSYLPRAVDAVLTLSLWIPLIIAVYQNFRVSQIGLRYLLVVLVLLLPAIAVWVNRKNVHPSRIYFSRLTTGLGFRRLMVGISISGILFLLTYSTTDLLNGATYCLGFSIVFGLGLATNVRRSLSMWVVSAVALVIGIGLRAILVLSFDRIDFAIGLAAGMLSGAVSMIVAVRAGILAMSKLGLGQPDSWLPGPPTPLSSLNENTRAGVIVFILSGVAALYVGLASDVASMAPSAAIFLALSAGVAAGPGYVAGVWRRHLALIITTRRILPVRLASFLQWAHNVGILRARGRSYEFRHERIELWLTGAREET